MSQNEHPMEYYNLCVKYRKHFCAKQYKYILSAKYIINKDKHSSVIKQRVNQWIILVNIKGRKYIEEH